MATAVGDLVINLLARNKASGPIGAVGDSLKRLGGMLAGIAGVGGFGLMIRSQFQAIDATAKLADRLGTTTEQLAGLSHAATLSGSSQATLGRSLQFLSKSLGEASTGVGESRQALAMLGLSVDDLLGKNPAEQFRMIAEAVSHLSSQEEKAYATTKLFGRAGGELLNTLQMGAAGLDQVQAEVEALNGAWGRLDAAKVEEANDAMARLKLAATGGFARIAIGIAPAVKALADGLAPALAGVGRLLGAVIRRIAPLITIAMQLGAAFLAVRTAALLATVATKLYAGITMGVAAAMKAYATVMTAITLAMEIYRATTSKAAAATVFLQLLASPIGWIKVGAAIAVATAAIVTMNMATSSAGESLGTLNSGFDDMSDMVPGIDATSDAIDGVANSADMAADRVAALRDTLGLTFQSAEQQLSDAAELAQALQGMFPNFTGTDVFGGSVSLFSGVPVQIESLVEHFGSASRAAEFFREAIETNTTPLQAYEARLADIDAAAELLGDDLANALRADALAEYDRALGGPQQKFRDMADELARLKAGASEFEWQLRKWEEAGLGGVDAMRDMQAEINRINADKTAAKELQQFADGILKQIQTPAEKAAELAARLKEAVAKGLLTREQADLALQEEQASAHAQTALRGSAATKGSAEAYSRIYAAMDGGKGNPANATAENTKAMKSDLARMREGIDEMRRGKVRIVSIEEAAG